MKKGKVRLEMSCVKCDKISYNECLELDSFTWDCPHCQSICYFDEDKKHSISIEQMNKEAVEEHFDSEKRYSEIKSKVKLILGF